jgi:hypothetical protein
MGILLIEAALDTLPEKRTALTPQCFSAISGILKAGQLKMCNPVVFQ